jgi:hypothetical protein
VTPSQPALGRSPRSTPSRGWTTSECAQLVLFWDGCCGVERSASAGWAVGDSGSARSVNEVYPYTVFLDQADVETSFGRPQARWGADGRCAAALSKQQPPLPPPPPPPPTTTTTTIRTRTPARVRALSLPPSAVCGCGARFALCAPVCGGGLAWTPRTKRCAGPAQAPRAVTLTWCWGRSSRGRVSRQSCAQSSYATPTAPAGYHRLH